jgi:non-canonical (house-cleaning) NTP pyrophosphatase
MLALPTFAVGAEDDTGVRASNAALTYWLNTPGIKTEEVVTDTNIVHPSELTLAFSLAHQRASNARDQRHTDYGIGLQHCFVAKPRASKQWLYTVCAVVVNAYGQEGVAHSIGIDLPGEVFHATTNGAGLLRTAQKHFRHVAPSNTDGYYELASAGKVKDADILRLTIISAFAALGAIDARIRARSF